MKTGDLKSIELFCNYLQRFLIAVSWGGHESLVIPAAVCMARENFDEKMNHII